MRVHLPLPHTPYFFYGFKNSHTRESQTEAKLGSDNVNFISILHWIWSRQSQLCDSASARLYPRSHNEGDAGFCLIGL